MWIRSQDKMKLYNISKIKIEQFIDKYGIVDPSVEDWILGEYKSKERAIEILDEIQACISNIYEYEVVPPQNNDWFFSVQDVPRTNKVYNMPEE